MRPPRHSRSYSATISTLLGLLLASSVALSQEPTSSAAINTAAAGTARQKPSSLTLPQNLTWRGSRVSPWSSFSGKFKIPVRSVTSLRDLRVSAYGPYLVLPQDEPALQPMEYRPPLEVLDSNGISPPQGTFEIPAGQEVLLQLQLADFSKSGSIQFDLVLDPQNGEPLVNRTVSLLVKDHPWFPLCCILAGVLLTAFVRYRAQTLPREANRQRITAYRQQSLSREAPDIRLRLQQAEHRNEIALNALSVDRELDQIDQELPGSREISAQEEAPRQLPPEVDNKVTRREILLVLFSSTIAILVGLEVLYLQARTFGTFSNYLTAFLWGAGFDTTLRGFGGALNLITTLTAKRTSG